ncbi:hypothetical protein TB2_027396 [Malus domestica]
MLKNLTGSEMAGALGGFNTHVIDIRNLVRKSSTSSSSSKTHSKLGTAGVIPPLVLMLSLHSSPENLQDLSPESSRFTRAAPPLTLRS